MSTKLIIKSHFNIYLISSLAALTSLMTGYCHVFLSQLEKHIKNQNNFESKDLAFTLTLAISATNLGQIIGPAIYNYMANRFGEAQAFVRCSLGIIIAVALQLISLEWTYLIIGRLMLGIVIGVLISILPLYLNSISPLSISGKIGSLNQVMTCMGVIFAYLLGFLITDDRDDQIIWRILVGFPILPCLISIINFTFFFPFDRLERHLQNKQKKIIEHYLSLVYVNATYEDIYKQKMRVQGKSNHQRYAKQYQRYIIACVVIASNQLSGISGIFYFAKQLFQDITGGDVLLAQQLMLGLALCQAFTCIFCGRFIDLFGRKYLLIRGQGALIVILFAIFLIDNMRDYLLPKVVHFTIIALIYLHVIIFNVSLGPICMVYAAQLVTNFLPIVVSFRTTTLLVALTTNYIIHQFGIGQLFLIYAVSSSVAFYYLKDKLLETKGMPKRKIFAMFEIADELDEQKVVLA